MDRHPQGTRETRDNHDGRVVGRDFREGRDTRQRFGYANSENPGYQHREQWESREGPRDEGLGRGSYAGQKRMEEGDVGREVRQMTKEDLRHKLNREHEEKRRVLP